MKTDLIIAKQEDYIAYLNKVIDSENIISAISLGARGKYECEIAILKQDKPKDGIKDS